MTSRAMISSGSIVETFATPPIAVVPRELLDDPPDVLSFRTDVDVEHAGLLDRVVVALLLIAVRLEDVELARRLRRREQVACVRVFGHKAERLLLARAADHDRRMRPCEALRGVERTLEDETLSCEAGLVALPHAYAELERVLEPIEPFRKGWERDAERSRFRLVPRGADPEHRAAAGKDVEGGHGLCEHARIAIHDAGDDREEPSTLGVGREIAERRVCLEHLVLGRTEAADLEEMVHDADRIEAAAVRNARDRGEVVRDTFRPARPGEGVDLQAELQRAAFASVVVASAPSRGRPNTSGPSRPSAAR